MFVLKAFCIFSVEDSVLVYRMKDEHSGSTFYRFVGGKVNFGEKSADTICREVKEETGLELRNPRLLTVVENVFTYNGVTRHEVDFIYDGTLSGKAHQPGDTLQCDDDGRKFVAKWKTSRELEYEGLPVYPWNPFGKNTQTYTT
ncbi:MAG: NUDIX domain-containing protein [Thermoprotei archaeon]